MLNFELILDMQKELDSKINNCRERTAKDIMISFIAELVEWNETTDSSHKTWKHKTYTRSEQLEEWVDGLFFISQLFNIYFDEKVTIEQIKKFDYYTALKNDVSNIQETNIFNILNLNALGVITCDLLPDDLMIAYIVFSEKLGYTEEEIEEEYKRKHRINLERINKKREEGGWK